MLRLIIKTYNAIQYKDDWDEQINIPNVIMLMISPDFSQVIVHLEILLTIYMFTFIKFCRFHSIKTHEARAEGGCLYNYTKRSFTC